ncbi:hypothetical protein IGK74_000560 [Enterococcus sp. AZ150]|uniref:hypothetical protein n=1 Tax=Enterococcus sp. AZ150 TaxID=2774866 RepID=UPI003F21F217
MRTIIKDQIITALKWVELSEQTYNNFDSEFVSPDDMMENIANYLDSFETDNEIHHKLLSMVDKGATAGTFIMFLLDGRVKSEEATE